MKKFLYFSAPWCGPCQQLGPIMEELQLGGIRVQKIDVDSNPELCQTFNVRNIPTVVLTVNNADVGRKVGLNPKQAYLDMYNQN
jgi:thioredoxin-like negative regulator of GroEL